MDFLGNAPFRRRLLAATSVLALAMGAGRGLHADPYSGYEAYPLSTDPAEWTVDRHPSAAFENIGLFQGRDDVIRLTINPPATPGSFYNWQGYKQRTRVPAGSSFLRGDMWIPDGWRSGTNADYVNAGIWGSVTSEELAEQGRRGDALFPIMHFSNQGGEGRIVVWEPWSGEWVELSGTAELVNYGSWNTLDMRLLPEEKRIQYVFNGEVIYTWEMPAEDTEEWSYERFFEAFLNARNNGVTTFDTHWSRLLAGLVIEEGQAIADTNSDVLVDPDAGASGVVVVSDGASLGGSIMAEGGDSGAHVVFEGSADVSGDVIGENADFAFGADVGDETTIGGDLELEDGSSTGGGTVTSPVEVAGGVNVDGTSTLGGNWHIGTDLRVDGKLSPGNSIGVVTVVGNHAFGPGSIYDVEINSHGESDRLDVGGTATLDGTVRVTPLEGPDDLVLGTPYAIVTAAGGFGGTAFDSVTWSHPSAFVAPALSYDGTTAYVTVERNGIAFVSAATSANEAAVAAELDSLLAGNVVHDAVALSTADAAQEAFDALSGEIHASAKSVLLEDGRHLRTAVVERMRRSLAEGGEDPSRTVRDVPGTVASMWTHGYGSWGRLDGNGNASAVDRDTRGVLVGVDVPVADHARVGLAGGYSRTSLDSGELQSSATVDSYHASIYGGTRLGAFGLRAGASHSWHGVATSRTIGIGNFSDAPSAEYDVRTAQAFGEVGYELLASEIGLEPFAGLSYVHLDAEAFEEDGGDAALSGDSDHSQLVFSTLGMRFDKAIGSRNSPKTSVSGMIGWRHAYGDTAPSAELALDGATPFTIAGAPVGQDSLVLTLGFDMDVGPGVSLGATYSGQASSDAVDHGLAATLGARF